MTAVDAFFREARARYVAANEAAFEWMLSRPAFAGAFLNTKVNSITQRDYGPDDGLRAPGYTFGWIQGRGLEALATHSAFFETVKPSLAHRMDEWGRRLYAELRG